MESRRAGREAASRSGRPGVGWIGTAAIFLLLTALWLWCRNGGHSLIRVVVSGDEVRAYFDGRLIAEGRDAGLSPEGGIGIWYGRDQYWGIPVPQALESLRVTDNASGALLFDQDFRKPLSDAWTERPASCEPSRAGLRGDRARGVRVCTGLRDWKDYTLDLRVRNCTSMEIAVRYLDPANHAVLSIRPFRELASALTFVKGGARNRRSGDRPYYAARMAAKSILLLFLYWFPWCALAFAALAAAGSLTGFAAAHIMTRGAVSRTGSIR